MGSITHIADAYGSLRQELSYDAWGRLRNPSTQAVYAPGSEPALLLGRGYTGHEHLTWFGLINMNARLYDPALGRFLSPDPYVQAPDFTQNFNRYSYRHNPIFLFSATDIQQTIRRIRARSGRLRRSAQGPLSYRRNGDVVSGARIGGGRPLPVVPPVFFRPAL